MQLVILGTSAMVPTKTRNHSSYFISYGSDGLLFDCGEGTQRQLKMAGIKLSKINKIFISHWHGDHVLGLPGLLQSLTSDEYNKKMQIFGPKGIKKKFELLEELYPSDEKIDKEIIEITKEIILETSEYKILSLPLLHKPTSHAFSFIENDKRKINTSKLKKLGIPEGPLVGKLQNGKSVKHNNKTIMPDDVSRNVAGKRITYIADTKNCENTIKIAKNSDILICESTYMNSESDKAKQYYHMTSSDAARVAQMSDSKKLILTHFSQRYKDLDELLEEAKEIFPNTIIGFDLQKFKI